MISTATTKLDHPRAADGGLRDPHPVRRAARLRAGDVRIERERPLRHIVHLPDGSRHHRRTFGGAERVGHGYLDRSQSDHGSESNGSGEGADQSGLRSFLRG